MVVGRFVEPWIRSFTGGGRWCAPQHPARCQDRLPTSLRSSSCVAGELTPSRRRRRALCFVCFVFCPFLFLFLRMVDAPIRRFASRVLYFRALVSRFKACWGLHYDRVPAACALIWHARSAMALAGLPRTGPTSHSSPYAHFDPLPGPARDRSTQSRDKSTPFGWL